jgi:hypothetical protein
MQEKIEYHEIVVSLDGDCGEDCGKGYAEDGILRIAAKMRKDTEYSGGVEVELLDTPVCNPGQWGFTNVWSQIAKVTGKGKCIKSFQWKYY